MPTYDYRCDACGHELELFQSFSESAKRKCPACKELKLKRLIGMGGGVIFKGSGFYQTDYRSESYKKGAEADKKSRETSQKDSKEESKATGATETKKADKPAATKKPKGAE
ncbi:MAG: putative FmdB family regulatory protein [Planctomycetota bacterium]|jgi:putative FmdB family regulatory protein